MKFKITFSGTANGTRPGSANALSQVTVAQACGSWLPWTITTTGKDRVQTLKFFISNNEFLIKMKSKCSYDNTNNVSYISIQVDILFYQL